MDIKDVQTTGPALASLLQSMARNHLDFDGLILGSYETRTMSLMHDDRAEENSESLEARISSFQSFASVCSFYNPAGQIDGEKLAALVLGQQDTVLGWFVSRRVVWAKPSARDSAVCAHLPVCLARLQPQTASKPMLFGVFTAGEDHNGATLGFQQRLYQQLLQQEGSYEAASSSSTAASGVPPPQHRPQPVPMRIINLGSLQGARTDRAYEQLSPVAGLPPVPPPVPVSSEKRQQSNGDSRSKAGAGPVALSEKELQHIAVADVERQVAGVEAVYKALMSQIASLEIAVNVRSTKLTGLLADIDDIS